MYSITGDVAAYNGDADSSGSVYYGQRVYPRYTFTWSNSWTSWNNLGGTMYAWKNNEWTPLWDMQSNNVDINQYGAYNKYSSLYPYTVPDNSANTNGSNRIPILFASEWTADAMHTYQSRWVDIPIVKADAEITNIRLIDENGYYLDPTDLEAGQSRLRFSTPTKTIPPAPSMLTDMTITEARFPVSMPSKQEKASTSTATPLKCRTDETFPSGAACILRAQEFITPAMNQTVRIIRKR